jgi:hypothetical protein
MVRIDPARLYLRVEAGGEYLCPRLVDPPRVHAGMIESGETARLRD